MKYNAHNYQNFATKHLLENRSAGLFMEMGLGKTAPALTAIDILKYEDLLIRKTLVIAPLRVADSVWTAERDKWDHLRHLKISKVLGTETQRLNALRVDADIYTINRENLAWLVSHYSTAWPFDCVVIDELSSFKNNDSKRFKAFRIVRPLMRRVIGLTGTPAPNGLIDLWAQLFCLDQGERLFKTVGEYRRKYFSPAKKNGAVVFTYAVQDKAAEKEIHNRISDICISMKESDYLTLPPFVETVVPVILPPAIQQGYDDFERDQIMQYLKENGDTVDIPALSAAALSGKLLQYANGAVYDPKKEYHVVHDQKLDALEDVINEVQGAPILIGYNFISDCERIIKRFKAVKIIGQKEIDAWNRGELPIAIGHAASMGHGLNLQDGGNYMAAYGLPWSLELYQQWIKRLSRQGQKKPVFLYKLLCPGTIDMDVNRALELKAKGQAGLMEAIKARIEKYKDLVIKV